MRHEIIQLDREYLELMKNTLNNSFYADFVRVDGVTMPYHYDKIADDIDNFEVRDDDVWVCSFPKTGTTWTQEMVSCIANGLDSEEIKIPLSDRFPYFDLSANAYFSGLKKVDPSIEISDKDLDSVNYVASLPSPRFIKTHLPFHLLPRQIRTGEKKPKIIYVARNAKDTCISYYHHNKTFGLLNGSFEEWCNLFLADAVVYGPFWKHVLGYWDRRNDENLLFNTFEDMKQDLSRVIKITARFLGKDLTADQLSALTDHLSFKNMKANPAANNENLLSEAEKLTHMKCNGIFMRSGQTEQWKTVMSPEITKRFDDWTAKNLMGTDLFL